MEVSHTKTELAHSLTLKDILLYGLAYLLWLVNSVACVAAVIQLRSTVNVLWVALGGDRYSLSLVNQVCLLLGSFIAFVYVMFLESYYRESVPRRVETPVVHNAVSEKAATPHQTRLSQWLTYPGFVLLLWRFAITTAIPLGLLVVFLIMNEVALRVLH